MDETERIPGGPGWHIDPRTLLPVLTDERAFRDHHGDDPFCDAIVLLWSGDPVGAEAALQRAADDSPPTDPGPPAARWRALLADAWRDQGRTADAVAAYDRLVGESRGTPREAAMAQHRGKTRFAAGDLLGATEDFARALELRLRDGAPADLVESSRAALARVRALVASRDSPLP